VGVWHFCVPGSQSCVAFGVVDGSFLLVVFGVFFGGGLLCFCDRHVLRFTPQRTVWVFWFGGGVLVFWVFLGGFLVWKGVGGCFFWGKSASKISAKVLFRGTCVQGFGVFWGFCIIFCKFWVVFFGVLCNFN